MYYDNYETLSQKSEQGLKTAIQQCMEDYLSDVKTQMKRLYDDLTEARELNAEQAAEIERKDEVIEGLRNEKNATVDGVLRQQCAVPIDQLLRYAKVECTSWAEAKVIYDFLVDYADGNRDIKQKAKAIKAYHTRKTNAERGKTEYHYAAGAIHNDSRKMLSVAYEIDEENDALKLIS